jgi:uncharacterized protein
VTARLAVRLTPRGGRDRIEGADEDAAGRRFLKVRVSAPPADGQANAALLRLLAKALGVGATALHICSGATARLKVVEAQGLSDAELAERLA